MPRPVFLAAPEQGAAALGLIDKVVLELQIATGGALKGSHIFVPHLQVGDVGIETDAATYFSKSLAAIQEARVVVAVLDGLQADENVAFLCGYAFAAGKPVVGFSTDGRAKGTFVENVLTERARNVHELQAALARILL